MPPEVPHCLSCRQRPRDLWSFSCELCQANHLNVTERALERLTLPSEGEACFYDTDTKRVAISVGKTGRKSFLLYRRIQGRPERIKIGRYPDVSPVQDRRAVKPRHETV